MGEERFFPYHTRKLLDQNLGEKDEGDAPSKEKGPCLYYTHRGLTPPPPPPLSVAQTGRNKFNEEINPHLPTGIGERCSQTLANLGHAALRPM
jgi:hypothetical protein